ncbi:HPr family phosphocarrier protein [Bacillus glycinifermentans]|nr:HPr family phosphocarrier protein [Bacillus glycinifermentans]MBU8785146.1 HPr family phosphocarrier protein [Bacillus glycinifermentans]
MIVKKLIVQLPRGLQARHSAVFVRKAFTFKSEIVLTKNGRSANGKDIMEIMNLAVQEGDDITLITDGIDEQDAAKILEKILSTRKKLINLS